MSSSRLSINYVKEIEVEITLMTYVARRTLVAATTTQGIVDSFLSSYNQISNPENKVILAVPIFKNAAELTIAPNTRTVPVDADWAYGATLIFPNNKEFRSLFVNSTITKFYDNGDINQCGGVYVEFVFEDLVSLDFGGFHHNQNILTGIRNRPTSADRFSNFNIANIFSANYNNNALFSILPVPGITFNFLKYRNQTDTNIKTSLIDQIYNRLYQQTFRTTMKFDLKNPARGVGTPPGAAVDTLGDLSNTEALVDGLGPAQDGHIFYWDGGANHWSHKPPDAEKTRGFEYIYRTGTGDPVAGEFTIDDTGPNSILKIAKIDNQVNNRTGQLLTRSLAQYEFQPNDPSNNSYLRVTLDSLVDSGTFVTITGPLTSPTGMIDGDTVYLIVHDSGAVTLNELTDCTVNLPQQDDILVYNAVSGNFENGPNTAGDDSKTGPIMVRTINLTVGPGEWKTNPGAIEISKFHPDGVTALSFRDIGAGDEIAFNSRLYTAISSHPNITRFIVRSAPVDNISTWVINGQTLEDFVNVGEEAMVTFTRTSVHHSVHTVDPNAGDDFANNYFVGHQWVNTVLNRTWISVSDNTGAAVWVQTNNIPPPADNNDTGTWVNINKSLFGPPAFGGQFQLDNDLAPTVISLPKRPIGGLADEPILNPPVGTKIAIHNKDTTNSTSYLHLEITGTGTDLGIYRDFPCSVIYKSAGGALGACAYSIVDNFPTSVASHTLGFHSNVTSGSDAPSIPFESPFLRWSDKDSIWEPAGITYEQIPNRVKQVGHPYVWASGPPVANEFPGGSIYIDGNTIYMSAGDSKGNDLTSGPNPLFPNVGCQPNSVIKWYTRYDDDNIVTYEWLYCKVTSLLTLNNLGANAYWTGSVFAFLSTGLAIGFAQPIDGTIIFDVPGVEVLNDLNDVTTTGLEQYDLLQFNGSNIAVNTNPNLVGHRFNWGALPLGTGEIFWDFTNIYISETDAVGTALFTAFDPLVKRNQTVFKWYSLANNSSSFIHLRAIVELSFTAGTPGFWSGSVSLGQGIPPVIPSAGDAGILVIQPTGFNIPPTVQDYDKLIWLTDSFTTRTPVQGQIKVNSFNTNVLANQQLTFTAVTTEQEVTYRKPAETTTGLNASSFPTTSIPLNQAPAGSPFVDSYFWEIGATQADDRFKQNPQLGSTVTYRVEISYSNKPVNNTGRIQLRLYNPDSGFSLENNFPLSTGLTADTGYMEFITISDSANIGASLGYKFGVSSTTSLDIVIESISAISHEYSHRG